MEPLGEWPATRNSDHLAGDIAGVLRGEKDKSRRKFRGLSDPSDRDIFAELPHLFFRHG